MRISATSARPRPHVSPQRLRAQLAERLAERKEEIEATVLARVSALEDPAETGDPTYVEGLRIAVAHALAYALEAIERSESRPAPIPTALFAQARHAARNGVSLDTVLRRYFAGYTLFGDFVHRVAEEVGALETEDFGRLRRDQAALLDRLLAAISEEHGRERSPWRRSSSEHRAELVRRMLAGELLDTAELGYEMAVWHLGLVVTGVGAQDAVLELATTLASQLLWVPHTEGEVWAWLGAREEVSSAELIGLSEERLPEGASLGVGEPARGADGWRLTHRQAAAALSVARRSEQPVARYADVALLAALLRDELLATSLRQVYLAPLERERDGGKAAKATLRAYFETGHNVSCTAAALGVKRHTVTNRLRAIEQATQRPLDSFATEFDAALRLERLEGANLAPWG